MTASSMLQSESRGSYSWWWDSHICPKNSKWLQQHLTDMDAKVKAMIKLIEDDSDSFAKSAEMFYKKRPELMKLLEEFFRAYRAFAERYDHAAGAFLQAHQTMTEASPNHVPFVLSDDSLSGYSQGTEPHAHKMPHPGSAPFGSSELHKDVIEISTSDLQSDKVGSFIGDFDAVINKGGIKQIYEMFGSREPAEGILRRGQIPDKCSGEKNEYEQIVVHHILKDITNLKHFLSQCSEDMQRLIIENSILVTLIGQLRSEGLELVSQKSNSDNACKIIAEKLFLVQSEKDELCEKNRQLGSQASMNNHQANLLQTKVESLSVKKADVERVYHELQEAYSRTLEENRTLLKKLSNLKDENSILEEEKDTIILEMFASGNLSTIFKRYITESAAEVKVLMEDLNKLHGVNYELKSEVNALREKLFMDKTKTLHMSLELQERQDEFRLWDAEVSIFYFDSQVSVIRELLFEDKVHELTGVCKSLQDETASKAQVIEQLREKISSKESEIAILQNQLLAYGPAIVSPSDYTESLDHSLFSGAKLDVAGNEITKDVEIEAHAHERNLDDMVDDQYSHMPDDLVEETNKHENSNPNIKLEDATREIEHLESENATALDKIKQGGDGGVEDARALIHHGKGSSSVKRKSGRFYWCFKPSTEEDNI